MPADTAFNLKKVGLFSFLYFAVLSTGIFCIFFYSARRDNEVRREETIRSETRLNESESDVISARISRLTTHLLYIRDTIKLNGLDKKGIENIKKQWVSFADNIKLYDQIRYLDSRGNEIIRINYSDKGSYVVPEDSLQNKAGRYYFDNSIVLQPDQIYVSRLDLNIEHNEIEKPDKPMIRFVIPYVDDTGVKCGEVILNYMAKDLLDILTRMCKSSRGYTYFLNSAGYWLYNSENSSLEWTFMYEDRKKNSFANQYPFEWSKIVTLGKGTLVTANGVFVYSSILTAAGYTLENNAYSLFLDEGDWHIVTHIKADSHAKNIFMQNNNTIAQSIMKQTAPFFGIIWLLSFIIAFTYQDRKTKKKKMQYLSQFDEMTGTYNRHAGYEKLAELCSNGTVNEPFAIAFIDIDGLKQVNDTFGHEAGDKLIIQAVCIIKSCIRNYDSIARLGGDEFMIICRDATRNIVELTWDRIQTAFDKTNEEKRFPFTISASHGATEYITGDTEETIIERADKLMYEEKKAKKAERT